MASIRKIASGWQAQVARQGIRKSKTFPSKREAQDWAAREEHLILSGRGKYGPGTFGDVLKRYAETESPKKRGERWEVVRLRVLRRDEIAEIKLSKIGAADFADWRDRRLKEVSPGSVIREMTLLRAVCRTATQDWGLFPRNPIKGVANPKAPPRRNKLVTDDEIAALAEAAGGNMRRQMPRAVLAFRFACLTAMRAGEICNLRRADVDGNVAHVRKSKTGKARDVPLSSAALAIWESLPDGFGLSAAQLDAAFRKARDKAKLSGFTFHDSRHRAITDLSKKVGVLSLARIVGHDNVNQLLTYYEETAADIAAILG